MLRFKSIKKLAPKITNSSFLFKNFKFERFIRLKLYRYEFFLVTRPDQKKVCLAFEFLTLRNDLL